MHHSYIWISLNPAKQLQISEEIGKNQGILWSMEMKCGAEKSSIPENIPVASVDLGNGFWGWACGGIWVRIHNPKARGSVSAG